MSRRISGGAFLPLRLWTQSAVYVAVALAVVVVMASISLAFASQSVTYTDNGLTCPIPSDYQSFKAAVHLVPIVAQQPQFLSLADGSPYLFGGADNQTERILQIDNQPVQHLPDAVEIVFATYGPTTSCVEVGGIGNPWLNTIVVQVPIQDGGFNLTGATYHFGGGPK